MTKTTLAPEETPHRAERWTSIILRFGVWISAGLMMSGLLMAGLVPSSIVPLNSPSFISVAGLLLSGSINPGTLMFAGLVVLMFTPILRVATAIGGFAVERDWRFVIVSSIVLLMLASEIIYSIFLKG
jgi:uncharacterized membrane protein